MYKIQEIFHSSYNDYCNSFNPSLTQHKAALSIMNCKSGELGYSISTCGDCGHVEIHNNSCRNRSCPCCQAVQKELWIDARKAEVIDSAYFHVVFTVPAELNPIIYSNQKLLYSTMHKCASETLITLSADNKYLGATPGIIQVLHTWGQEMNYHPHIHCIVTGAGLTKDKQLKRSSNKFFIPVKVLGKMFRGKLLSMIESFYRKGKLKLAGDHKNLNNSYYWKEFRDCLYKKTWIPYIKETFNGFGNAIDYLGRYTHRIAISNARIKTVTATETIFFAKDYKTGESKEVTISNKQFIRRFLMHVLPLGFQKIRYYGFLNNRSKKENLKLISKLTRKALFKSLYANATLEEKLLSLWNIDPSLCKKCGHSSMRPSGRVFPLRN